LFKLWYHENKSFAEYLIELTELNNYNPEIEKLRTGKRFAENPEMIKNILYLDIPDVIITYGFPEKPILGVEFCAEAPSGHDVFQRVARVAAAAEFGAPFAFIFPEKKWVIREKMGGRWDLYNPLSMRALINIGRLHKIPILAFFWEADQTYGNKAQGFLQMDEEFENLPDRNTAEIRKFIEFVNKIIYYTNKNLPFSEMVYDPFVSEREAWMWRKYCSRFERKPDLFRWSPLTSCRLLKTEQLIDIINEKIGRAVDLPQYILSRDECIVYEPRTKQFRADPYAGSLIGIDYLVCRTGQTIRHRYRNLIMHFKEIEYESMKEKYLRYYFRSCPFNPKYDKIDRFLTLHLRDGCRYTKQKELRIYCYIADLLMFADAVLC